MAGWRDGLGPWTPVLEGDRLYGRGGADDGYAAFASLTAIEAVQAGGGSHARCMVLIEASEESASARPAGACRRARRTSRRSPASSSASTRVASTTHRMWVTTSIRGMVLLTLTVDIVTEGLHSGDVSGMVPSTFRIARSLLSRIENETTGELLLASCRVDVPEERLEEARSTAADIGAIADQYPFVPGARPTTPDGAAQLVARTWQGTLSVTGADGLPPTSRAGNVLRPSTSLRLVAAAPADGGPSGRPGRALGHADGRSTVRRADHVVRRRFGGRLECSRSGAVAGRGARRRVERRVRSAGQAFR